jgi:hypothetical protein
METALRRLDGVDKISISVSEQKFQVTLKPGAAFNPADIRAAVGKAGVKVVRFRIDARGRVEEQGGKRYFFAGEDKFLVAAPAKMADGPVAIEGTVDDAAAPWQLKILKSKPLPPQTAVKRNGG